MNEIKLSLTILLPGRTMLSKVDSLKEMQKGNEIVVVEDYDKCDKSYINIGKRTYTIHTRKHKPATQKMNLGRDAYKYFISDECPYWCKPKVWSNLSRRQRLLMHLEGIAESLNGKLQSFEVFED